MKQMTVDRMTPETPKSNTFANNNDRGIFIIAIITPCKACNRILPVPFKKMVQGVTYSDRIKKRAIKKVTGWGTETLELSQNS